MKIKPEETIQIQGPYGEINGILTPLYRRKYCRAGAGFGTWVPRFNGWRRQSGCFS